MNALSIRTGLRLEHRPVHRAGPKSQWLVVHDGEFSEAFAADSRLTPNGTSRIPALRIVIASI
jgi:hypothetical protein